MKDWVSVTTQPGASRANPTTPESKMGRFKKFEMSKNKHEVCDAWPEHVPVVRNSQKIGAPPMFSTQTRLCVPPVVPHTMALPGVPSTGPYLDSLTSSQLVHPVPWLLLVCALPYPISQILTGLPRSRILGSTSLFQVLGQKVQCLTKVIKCFQLFDKWTCGSGLSSTSYSQNNSVDYQTS
jgi:hypothetical protein